MAPKFPYPNPSVQERDRRWAAVRDLMREQDLAAIVTPPNTGHSLDFQANSRYLSCCGGGEGAEIAVVFPLEADVTVVATSAVHRWPPVQDWVTDIREARRDYGRGIIDRLRELGVAHQRVGVTGLGRGTRTPEGTVLYHTMRRLYEELPDTEFVDATELLEQVRDVKSDEEIEFLRLSNTLVDRAYETALEVAGPGVVDHLVWAKATATMLEGGSEPTVHTNWVSGRAPARTLTRASFRQLEAGDIIIGELESSWGGYRAQGVQPICVGSCDQEYLELLKLQSDVFDDCLDGLRPGVTVGDLVSLTERSADRHRPAHGAAAGAVATLTMHGRGLGDDGPITTGSSKSPEQMRRQMRTGMVLILKPSLKCAAGCHPVNWGDTVVVTPDGGRRLGSRSQGMWVA